MGRRTPLQRCKPVAEPSTNLANTSRDDRVLRIEDIKSAESSDFLLTCGNAGVRAAIRRNAVTFPSQMVRLRGSGEENDEPERIVHLYFICGWSVGSLSQRYGLSRKQIEDILTRWRQRAIAAGFIQEIQPSKTSDDGEGLFSSSSSPQYLESGFPNSFGLDREPGNVQAA